MFLFFEYYQDVGDVLPQLPEEPNYYGLVRWIVGGLLALLTAMVWTVRALFKNTEKVNNLRLEEKQQQITDLQEQIKTLQDKYDAQVADTREVLAKTAESFEDLLKELKNG